MVGKEKSKIALRSTGIYPCSWDDLIYETGRTYATVYTLENARENGFLEPGITKGDDGIFDIVIDAPELTEDVLRDALNNLSSTTGIKYNLQV